MGSFSLSERVKRIVRLARTALLPVATTQQIEQQVEYLGKAAKSIVFHPYGLTSAAPPDTLSLLFAQMGNPEALVHMPGFVPLLNRPLVPPLPGDVVLYSPVSKAEVRVTALGLVTVTAGATIFSIGPTGVTVVGDLTVTGDVATVGTLTNNGVDVGGTHAHVGSPSAPTGAISNTGAPI